MEKIGKKDFMEIVAVCIAVVIAICAFVAYEVHSNRVRKEHEAWLSAERAYKSAESGFKTMLGYGEDDTGLVITNTDFGNHFCQPYGNPWGVYVDTVYFAGVKDTEIILIQYSRSGTGSDFYAVSNVDCNENCNGVGIKRTPGDSVVYFDSSDISVESVNSFGVYDTVTKELYIPKYN